MFPSFVYMKFRKKCHCQINHFKGFRHNNGFSSEAGKPMSLSTIILLNIYGLGFALI